MCYEERFFGEWATKKKRQGTEPAVRSERPTPGVQPERAKPESQKPTRPERELEPV
jgi:hypothetical protein